MKQKEILTELFHERCFLYSNFIYKYKYSKEINYGETSDSMTFLNKIKISKIEFKKVKKKDNWSTQSKKSYKYLTKKEKKHWLILVEVLIQGYILFNCLMTILQQHLKLDIKQLKKINKKI